MPNVFLIQGNMIKKKSLPFYEDQQLNFYIRSRSNPLKTMDYINSLNSLHPVMQSGNLWTTIKNLFKKGKNYAKKAIDYIDQSPILSTVKDIGFDVLKEKTGVDANDYYNTARNVINMTPEDANKTAYKLMDTTKNKVHDYITRDKSKPFDYKQTLKDYYTDIVKSVPQYEPQIKQNFDLFSSGSELAGNNETIMRNIPKLLMLSKSSRGGFVIKKEFKPLLLKYGIKTLTVPKTLKEFAEKMKNNINQTNTTTQTESKGRLYMGRGENESKGPLTIANNTVKTIKEPKSGKLKTSNKIDRYNEILNKLKK